ncbi:MAG: hypothetical protein KDD62_10290, partial [Bdellovibrionales bacterium]|nr:hypothetical protein [Bdellovibrionales bacterium]
LYEGEQAKKLVYSIPLRDVTVDVLRTFPWSGGFESSYAPGSDVKFSDVQPSRIVDVNIKLEDVQGRTNLMSHGLNPHSWESSNTELLQTTPSLSVPSWQPLTVYPPRWTPYAKHPVTYRQSWDGFGFQKELTSSYTFSSEPRLPIAFRMLNPYPRNGETPAMEQPVEFVQGVSCYLAYPDDEVTSVPCNSANIEMVYEDSLEPVANAGYYFDHNGSSLVPVVWGAANIDRVILVRATHRETGFSAEVELANYGIDNFSHSLESKPYLPDEPALKADDDYCTNQKRELLPVAGGTGTEADPYLICSAHQLHGLEKLEGPSTINAYVKFLANLDFSSVANMEPVEGISRRLMIYDGNGYRISNATILDRELSYVGLFRWAHEIKDLSVFNLTVRGDFRVGGLAAQIGHSVKRVGIYGGTIWGTDHVGVLAATASSTRFDQPVEIDQVLIKNVQLNFERSVAGCILGALYGFGRVENSICKNTSINSAGVQGLQSQIGGLFGIAGANLYPKPLPEPLFPSSRWLLQPVSYLFNSRFEGQIDAGLSVTGAELGMSDVGGLFGEGNLPIINSSVHADITTAGSGTGGFVGRATNCSRYTAECLIYNSQFEGSIIGGQNIDRLSRAGGMVGDGKGGMLLNNTVNAIVRGRQGIGGMQGNAIPLYRSYGNQAHVTVTSSVESHGGFCGTMNEVQYPLE